MPHLDDLGELEKPLATTRVIVSGSLTVIALALPETSEIREALLWACASYCAFAIWVRTYLAFAADPGIGFQLFAHTVDMVTAIAVAVVSPFPSIAALVIFLHASLAASVRWGRSASLACVAVAGATILFGGLRQDAAALGTAIESPGSTWLVMWSASIVAAGAVLSQLGDLAHERRSRARVLARLKASARAENGFRSALHATLAELSQSFGARGARLFAHDCSSNRAFLWELTGPYDTESSLQCIEVSESSGDRSGLEPFLEATSRTDVWMEPFSTSDWTGQVILIHPALGPGSRRRAKLFARVVRDLAPVLYDTYRVARVRARVVALERTRLARHLHDVTIQSLIGAEMEIDVLCHRYSGQGPASLAGDLSRIQTLVHRETLNLRDLMLQMKPLDITPDELPNLLQDIVGRFAYDTGVEATFRGKHLVSVHISPRMCTEIARIVQEALSNVRKHSGATHVQVRLEPTAGGLFLLIEDDGAGFTFDGRIRLSPQRVTRLDDSSAPVAANPTFEQLRSWKLSALRESVRSVGGELILQSIRGRGARLEILIPTQRGRDASRARNVS